MISTEEKMTGLPPDILEHFYDLRALAMSASAMSFIAEEEMDGSSDELNAVRRTLQHLSDMALQFANEADEFLLHAAHAQATKEEQAATA